MLKNKQAFHARHVFGLFILCLLTLVVYFAMSAATSAEAGGVRKSPARTELEDPDKGSFCWIAGKNTNQTLEKCTLYIFTRHTECSYTDRPSLNAMESSVSDSVHKYLRSKMSSPKWHLTVLIKSFS